ncbi:hypothetical protein HYX18_02720 [Candidatus Woesearchaeota archaeon]|nr:hypothetical protein [Candidatus Woesearchaeota archaeon]
MNNKADIWISAVLYLGLGVIILTLILAVGVPVVNKIRDKNIAIDTENLMLSLDNQIRAVYSEGPGSKRPFKFEIRKGNFVVNENDETINWNFETTALLSQPGATVEKGNMVLLTQETSKQGTYISSFQLNYSGILNIKLQGSNGEFTGANALLVSNSGATGTSLPTIEITPI